MCQKLRSKTTKVCKYIKDKRQHVSQHVLQARRERQHSHASHSTRPAINVTRGHGNPVKSHGESGRGSGAMEMEKKTAINVKKCRVISHNKRDIPRVEMAQGQAKGAADILPHCTIKIPGPPGGVRSGCDDDLVWRS
ncbi:hypothetical protein E2C01_098310 [Portunus trituberculatus]|uniref:Uncharacterized protein n=1 Tax=Portunus trituberculatus TaxID=210409 RepID=A0A5B7JXH8_PORTR|nr:hypothetical protein [Portunus trituberculatus]